MSTHRFDLGSVQFSPVQHDWMDGITCPGSLDRGGEHIQEVLEKYKKKEVDSCKSTVIVSTDVSHQHVLWFLNKSAASTHTMSQCDSSRHFCGCGFGQVLSYNFKYAQLFHWTNTKAHILTARIYFCASCRNRHLDSAGHTCPAGRARAAYCLVPLIQAETYRVNSRCLPEALL